MDKRQDQTLDPLPPPPTGFNQAILDSHVTTAQTLTGDLYGSGASSAVISSHATAASTCFSEMSSVGGNTQINSIITSNTSSINALGSTLTDAQIESIYNAISPMLPAFTESDVYQALSALSITSTVKQNLINQGIVPSQQSYISMLGAIEKALGGGVILASSGIHRMGPAHLEESSCVLYDVGLAGLMVSAIFTGGISLGVVAGVTVTYGMVFGAAAAVGGVFRGYANC